MATSIVAAASLGIAGERPRVSNPRATDGDEKFEPDWDKKLTLTVGPKKADLVGSSDKVIQAALDYVARLGSGTVKLLPGTYTCRNSISLPSRVRLVGSGSDSIITKIASETVEVSGDSDWYDQEITLKKKSGFRVGDGVTLIVKNPHNGSTDVIKRTLIASNGNRFKLNDGLRKNVWTSSNPTCNSIFPILTSEYTADVTIENLVLDGNKKNNINLNGNYGGNVFLQDCNRYSMLNVESRNYNGDGFSFQVCHDVVVENCYSHDNSNLGVHPGSGSQRPIIRNNRLHNNGLGLFWCWGVKYGLAENNKIDGNKDYGISIGHNDTDNVMRNNEISNSGKVGILFRDDSRGQDFWANRNLIENNKITNSGGNEGVAIDVRGKTKDIKLIGNVLSEERQPMKRTGIRISKDAGTVVMGKNKISGFAQDILDERVS
jgi:parallel beta-helix repeat protein